MKDLPEKLDSAKIIEYLKSSRVDLSGNIPDRRYMYALGRNTLADILLVAIYTGEFDCEDKSFK